MNQLVVAKDESDDDDDSDNEESEKASVSNKKARKERTKINKLQMSKGVRRIKVNQKWIVLDPEVSACVFA